MPSKSINKTLGGLTVRLYVNKAEQAKIALSKKEQTKFTVMTKSGRKEVTVTLAEFEKCTYLRLGEKESADQVETAIWLGQQSYVDKDRIGMWGWSYGGWNTLMSMSE